jgi:hypothetical protein
MWGLVLIKLAMGVIEQLARHALGQLQPIESGEGTLVPILGIVFGTILIVSLALSFWRRAPAVRQA